MDSITVGGPPGAGTSTLCKLLKDELDIDYVYAGQIFRSMAEEMNLSLAQFNDLCEKDPSYDQLLDNDMMDIARKGNVIVEGRMIGPLCKKFEIPSLKIYIHADPKIRAERILERDGGDLYEAIRGMKDREESEAQRYLEYYGIDPRERTWYDIVIDSTNISPHEELDIILKEMQKNG
jgi:predicted cytidylate kinase